MREWMGRSFRVADNLGEAVWIVGLQPAAMTFTVDYALENAQWVVKVEL